MKVKRMRMATRDGGELRLPRPIRVSSVAICGWLPCGRLPPAGRRLTAAEDSNLPRIILEFQRIRHRYRRAEVWTRVGVGSFNAGPEGKTKVR